MRRPLLSVFLSFSSAPPLFTSLSQKCPQWNEGKGNTVTQHTLSIFSEWWAGRIYNNWKIICQENKQHSLLPRLLWSIYQESVTKTWKWNFKKKNVSLRPGMDYITVLQCSSFKNISWFICFCLWYLKTTVYHRRKHRWPYWYIAHRTLVYPCSNNDWIELDTLIVFFVFCVGELCILCTLNNFATGPITDKIGMPVVLPGIAFIKPTSVWTNS